MPQKGADETTPMKPIWSRGSICTPTNVDNSMTKSCLEDSSNNLLDLSTGCIAKMLSPDCTMMSDLEETLEVTDSSDSSLLEQSQKSADSGVVSLEGDQEAVVVPSREHLKTAPAFRYKISIYSKVSGCRMTNLTEYWIVKQVRVAILQRLADGNPLEVLKYKFGYEKMANGGLQIISDSEALIKMLGSLNNFAGIPCKMTFPDTPRVVGFIKGLPTDLEPSDLKNEIRKSFPEVYSVRYVTEKSRGLAHGMQRPCAFVSFNLRFLPKSVRIFNETFELQVPNPMQCTRCCRYGHQGKQCRAQTRCSFCGGTHQRQLCTAKIPACINCLGNHTATSHDCLIWQQGKLMNELRYRGGMTAEEAIGIASSGKVSQKKHIFTQADFFENQDCFYFGNENAQPPVPDEGLDNHSEEETQSPQQLAGKITSVHPRAARIFPFLDLMTDLYLKVKNPSDEYSSSILMPGYDDLGFPVKKNKKNNLVARNFMDSVKAIASKTNSPESEYCSS